MGTIIVKTTINQEENDSFLRGKRWSMEESFKKKIQITEKQ